MTDMRDTLGDALHGPPSSKGGLHGLRRLLPFFGNAANGRARHAADRSAESASSTTKPRCQRR